MYWSILLLRDHVHRLLDTGRCLFYCYGAAYIHSRCSKRLTTISSGCVHRMLALVILALRPVEALCVLSFDIIICVMSRVANRCDRSRRLRTHLFSISLCLLGTFYFIQRVNHSFYFVSVKNPNFFAASFEKISATARYPINNAELGGGSRDDITFAANSETTFNFPFSIVYTASKDPNQVIVNDIADRCGFTGNARRQIQVKYEITLQIKMIAFSISPSFSGSTGFDCPLTQAQIEVSSVACWWAIANSSLL